MKGYITISSAAKIFDVSELCIWGLIRNHKVKASMSRRPRMIKVSIKHLNEYMGSHEKELAVWQKPKIWEKTGSANNETFYTNGIDVFSDKELERRSTEMERRRSVIGYYTDKIDLYKRIK